MKENTIEIILVEDNPADVEMTLTALKEHNLSNKVQVLKEGKGMSDNLRVLIVEHVQIDAELMEYELQKAGMAFSAKRVETKKAYIEALSTFLPDIILSDYSLPAFDGITALQLTLERAFHTPFIFVTGALGEELAIDLLKKGATDYVLKSRLSRLPVAVNRALREVEERKERERAHGDLHESEERHRVTLQAAMDGFFRADMQGRILEVNETYCRMSGYSEQELLTRNIADIEAVHSAELITDTIRRLAELGPSRFESVHRRKDGSLFDVEISAQHQSIAGGQAVAFVRDITERKRAEQKIQQQEKELRRVLEVTPQLVAVYGHDRERLYANRPTLDYFGVTLEEWQSISDPFWVFHPDDRERVAKDVYTGAASDVPHEFEARLQRKDGTYRWFLFRDNPLRDEQGRITRWYLSATDIEDRKRAEEALRQSEAYLAEAQRLSHTGSWAFDLAGNKYVYVSEECFRIFGFDAQESLPNREAISRLIHPEDWDSVNGDFEKLLREKVDTSSEFRIVLPSGTVKHVQTIRHPVLNEAGEVVTIVGTTIDITERKRAETEINSLKNYLSNIIDSMPSMLVGMDNTRTVTQWNRQAEAFTGIPAGEAIGKPIADLLPDFAPWIMSMGSDMDEHRSSSMEKLLIEKEGERRFYDLMLYPLLVDAVGGAVLRIEDVTERARVQELMVQTEKMMSIGGLAAGMAHEINNPLGIITQAAQNIERRMSLELHANRKVSEELGLNLEGIRAYFDKRQISDAVASIRTASSRAAKIVANMLQFSRHADTAMQFTSLAQIVDEALELAASDYDLKKKYDFRSIEIIKDYQDTPQVPIVSVEIQQVILNLLKNTAQAMIANPPDRRPRITLRLRCEDRHAVLEVEDNGPGMTEDIRRRVFEPFFTTKEPGVGTGLGLSVSYMIVTQNHKGLMEVQSTPGRGTRFKVRLPIGESKHEPVGKSIDCGR
jgi:PAS domain S-box-containing protein